jgi:hypothetical protein
MKLGSKREKWTAGILAVFCVGLLANLVKQTGVRAGAPRSGLRTPAPLGAVVAKSLAAPRARYGTTLDLELLEHLQSRSLPPLDRNPFEFGLTPAQKAAQLQEQKMKSEPTPQAPPPPPAVAVRPLGFTEDKSGQRKAIMEDDEQIYQVAQGASFAGRYRCLKITPIAVEIEDESYHQKVQLPFPQ